MRPARFVAAALATLALAAAGCKPESLTPFGLDERGQDSGGGYSGLWAGTTSQGGLVAFTVSAKQVTNLIIDLPDPCRGFQLEDSSLTIEDDSFSWEGALVPQGLLRLSGSFTSEETAVGSFSYSGIMASAGCTETSGQDVFTAEKIPPPNPEETTP